MQRLRLSRPRRTLDGCGTGHAHDRLRARFRRAVILARVLRPYGLTAHDDGVTDGITLSTLTGASEIVLSPQDLWPTAERLAGRAIDLLAV